MSRPTTRSNGPSSKSSHYRVALASTPGDLGERFGMAESKRYAGSCHCGKVRFDVTTDLTQVISCNCSICSRTGALLSFVAPEQFELRSGSGEQTDYQFRGKNIHHLFCATCGIRSFAHGTDPGGTPMYAINVRCLEGVDLASLEITPVDGKSF